MSYHNAILVPLASLLLVSVAVADVVDTIVFGDERSEQSHELSAELSKTIDGALGTRARQLLPKDSEDWRGGRVTFKMAVDPEKPNYFTAKFWGSDVAEAEDRLMLFIDGKQVGQRHLGEVDLLDVRNKHPRYLNKFFYKTLPLPEAMTRGKRSVELAIEAQGGIWAYGDTYAKFQKMMTGPSRGLYRAYTHTDPFIRPDPSEPQGEPKTQYPAADGPGPEVIDQVKAKVNAALEKLLAGGDELGTGDVAFLGGAYREPWTVAYQKPATLEKIVAAIDNHYREYAEKPDDDIGHWWQGYGPDAEVVHVLAKEVAPYFDTKLPGTEITRREAWGTMFQESRDWHAARRRAYTNQSMIVDMNTYRANRGLRVLFPDRAWPEATAMRLMHESAGLEPWSGNWNEKCEPAWSKGKDFKLLTDQAMTKELGYVGAYGDSVFDIMLHMYNATRPTPDAEGDARLKEQLVKFSRARSYFRYPLPDEEGHRTMQIESVIGWRDWKYPGGVAYDQQSGRAGGALDVAAATLGPVPMGFGAQMIEDNQLFAALAERAKGTGSETNLALMVSVEAYETFKKQPLSSHRLPMTPGQPDVVFADPEIGVVAIKNGDEILYASLYWRARYAINNLARVHHLTPTLERDANIRIETRFQDSGLVYAVLDRTNEPFSNRGDKEYKAVGMTLATAGEKQPIAKVPADQEGWKPGMENIFAGKGDLYVMEYGPYLVAMNCTKDQSFPVDVPARYRGGKELVAGETSEAAKITVKPMQTVAIYKK